MLRIEMPHSYISNRRWNHKRVFAIPISVMILSSIMIATAVVHAQSPDFAFNATPSNLCVNPGVNNGPTLSPIPSSETLAPGQSVSFDLAISTTTSTPLYTYSIRVSGLSGAMFHQTTVLLTVAAGCSVGGVVLPTVGLAPTTSYMVYGLVIAGLVGIVGATLAIRRSSRKPIPNP